MKVAIVILNWNGKKLLQQFLPNVIEHSIAFAEVYVADNNSDDDSVEFVRNNFPDVKIIQNAANGGYAKGYNDCLQHIDADIFALVNSDIEVSENWLPPIIEQFNQNEQIAAIQPKILDYKDKTKFEYAGAAGGFVDALGYPYCRGRVFQTLEEDNGQYNDNIDIFWASGACFFIRSEVFKQLNGFDEDYFSHQEEIDLCWRIHNLGLTIKYVGASTVYHVGGATLSNINPKKTYLNFRNSLFTLLKNLPAKSVFIIIFLRMVLDGIAGIKFLFELKPKHTWAIFKAHMSFYASFFSYYKKRKKNLTKNSNYYTITSIVFNYFVKGKKTV